MSKLSELMSELYRLNFRIKEFLNKSGYEAYSEVCVDDYDKDDIEKCFFVQELYGIADNLDRAASTISYLNSPIVVSGRLHKKANGRYMCDGVELTCGSGVEILTYDAFDDKGKWIVTRIEHDGNDYYAVGVDGKIGGKHARIRRRR